MASIAPWSIGDEIAFDLLSTSHTKLDAVGLSGSEMQYQNFYLEFLWSFYESFQITTLTAHGPPFTSGDPIIEDTYL